MFFLGLSPVKQNFKGGFFNPAFHYRCPSSPNEAHEVTDAPITFPLE